MRAAGPVDEMTRFPDSILAKQDRLSRWKDNKQALLRMYGETLDCMQQDSKVRYVGL